MRLFLVVFVDAGRPCGFQDPTESLMREKGEDSDQKQESNESTVAKRLKKKKKKMKQSGDPIRFPEQKRVVMVDCFSSIEEQRCGGQPTKGL